MSRPLDLEEDADLQPGKITAHFGNVQEFIVTDGLELTRLLQTIAGP